MPNRRFFLGVDLQCAQCHDHLFVDDYKQLDFQGLHSFLAHTFIRSRVIALIDHTALTLANQRCASRVGGCQTSMP